MCVQFVSAEPCLCRVSHRCLCLGSPTLSRLSSQRKEPPFVRLKLLHFQICHLFSPVSVDERLYTKERGRGDCLRSGRCSSGCSGSWKHDTRLKQDCHSCSQCLLDTEDLTSLNVFSLLLEHPLLCTNSIFASQYLYWYYFLQDC